MIVLDSVVVIALLDSQDMHHEETTRIIAENVEDDLTMNPVNQAEVLVRAAQEDREAELLRDLDSLGIGTTSLPQDAGIQLARLRARTRAKMPDCCVLLTAQQTSGRIVTFDAALQQAARSLGLGLVS